MEDLKIMKRGFNELYVMQYDLYTQDKYLDNLSIYTNKCNECKSTVSTITSFKGQAKCKWGKVLVE